MLVWVGEQVKHTAIYQLDVNTTDKGDYIAVTRLSSLLFKHQSLHRANTWSDEQQGLKR